jgi:hypothetical protein
LGSDPFVKCEELVPQNTMVAGGPLAGKHGSLDVFGLSATATGATGPAMPGFG